MNAKKSSSLFQRSVFLEKAERHAAALRVHAKGEYSAELMDHARPNEEDQYKEYRKNVFKSATKKSFGRVVTTLSKVRLAEDWRILSIDQSGWAWQLWFP